MFVSDKCSSRSWQSCWSFICWHSRKFECPYPPDPTHALTTTHTLSVQFASLLLFHVCENGVSLRNTRNKQTNNPPAAHPFIAWIYHKVVELFPSFRRFSLAFIIILQRSKIFPFNQSTKLLCTSIQHAIWYSLFCVLRFACVQNENLKFKTFSLATHLPRWAEWKFYRKKGNAIKIYVCAYKSCSVNFIVAFDGVEQITK